jgi:hypothetical protein
MLSKPHRAGNTAFRLLLSAGWPALGFFFQTASGMAAGPVYVREDGATLAVGNDFLERTISVADGEVGTVRFLNKISGRPTR